MLAGITSTPELEIDKSESQNLAQAIAEVTKHYDVEVAEKTIAWSNLLMVCGMIYGTRIVAIRNRHKNEDKTKTEVQNQDKENIIIPGVGKFNTPTL